MKTTFMGMKIFWSGLHDNYIMGMKFFWSDFAYFCLSLKGVPILHLVRLRW